MYFPEPYPGEALGSTIGRAVRHLGLPFRTFITRVLLRSDANLSFFLPSGLERLGDLTRQDSDALLAAHTPFAYWSAYLSPPEAQKLLAATLQARGAEPDAARQALKMAWVTYTRLRFCPECRSSNISRYGESFWHLTHLLPTVLDCPIHRCALLEDPHSWSERRAFRLLPQDLLSAAPVRRPPDAQISRALAGASLRLLASNWQRRDGWSELYGRKAERVGYRNPDGTVSAVQLTRDVERCFGLGFLEYLGCSLGEVPERAWPVLLLRPSVRSRFSPIKHLLLHCFLDLSDGPGPPVRRKRGPKPDPAEQLDGELASALQRRWDEAAAMGERLTVRAMLTSLGVWSMVRRRRRELARTSALILAFRRSRQWRSGGQRPSRPRTDPQ